MVRLLNAGFSRLFRKKSLYAVAFISFVTAIWMLCTSVNRGGEISIGGLFGAIPFLGSFSAIMLGLFLGTEYSCGTIRNKIAVGCDRASIYLSFYVMCLAVCAVICISMLLGSAVGCLVMGLKVVVGEKMVPLAVDIGAVIIWDLIGLLFMSLSYCAVITLICLNSSSKAKGSIGVLLIMLAILFFGVWSHSRLCEPEFVSDMYLVDSAITVGPEYPNPLYIGGSLRIVLSFLVAIMPSSQGILMADDGFIGTPLVVIGSISLAIALLVLGMCLFIKKDIK